MRPLYTAKQVREADNYALEKLNIPGSVLMENASRSVFEEILKNYKEPDRNLYIGIICGKGNNGGDGYALARHFINNGYKVCIVSLGIYDELTPDAQLNYEIIEKLMNIYTESIHIDFEQIKDLNRLNECSMIIDAVFGTGFKGEVKEPYKGIIEKLNTMDPFKISIDLPSGLDADTGYGDTVFRADLTITLAETKRGLCFSRGYVNSGTLVKGYIGIGDEYFNFQEIEDYLVEPEDALNGLPVKTLDLYKYTAGKVVVIAGSGTMPGAAVYAANSAMKSGAGAVYLAFPDSIKALAQTKLDAALVFAYRDEGSEIFRTDNLNEIIDKVKWSDVTAIGPGLGREADTADAVIRLLEKTPGKKMVIDADALWALRNNRYQEVDLSNKILTPHYREFCELIGIDLKTLQKDVLFYGKEFSAKTQSYLVLKGAPTIIFTPEGDALINSTGNPGMAKFGSGDVLTGIIAGFTAQSDSTEEVLVSAVYLHSLSADLLLKEKTEFGINPSDIIENFPNAINFLRKSLEQ